MKNTLLAVVILFLINTFGYSQKNAISMTMNEKVKNMVAPVADIEETILEKHGDKRIDNYYWMKLSDEQKNAKTPDNKTQKVTEYIDQENKYTEEALRHLEELKENLFQEIKGRIKQTDLSVPYKYRGYFYSTKYKSGQEYPIYSRHKGSMDAVEEVMLDVNVLAKDYDFYNVGGRNVSPDNTMIAYGEDTLSRRIYTIRFKNLNTGEMIDDMIENTTGRIVWANDNKTVFYTRKDEALRSYKIFKHKLGTKAEDDIEVFHEKDETFRTYIYKSKSEKYLIIGSDATLSNEYRILDADTPDGEFKIFQNRVPNLEYSIRHFGDNWYILTNKDNAYNFKLMVTPVINTEKSNWEEMVKHREDVLLEGVDIFKNYMVLSERTNASTYLQIRPWNHDDNHYIEFDEEVYSVETSINPDFDSDLLRISYTSLTTPNSTYDYNMGTQVKTLMKQQEVVGGYDSSNYRSERVFVTARDGAKVPMSIVYHKDYKKDGTRPTLLYGYGSYGYSMDPYFSSARLSLLDRGFAFAIAHIRGGQEMGRQWYENGKFLKKKNTFTDFIDCGKHLIDSNFTDKENLFGMGGSAGGLLMGAVMNMEPTIWKGIIAAVPFVDVVTTMLDETIPLTTGEYDEWGNPNDAEYYHYMKSYSPVDNVQKMEYPATLITTGYFDSQVQYWEPLKWIAKLRAYKTDDNPLMLLTNMDAGHGGKSGRFQRLKEIALEYAFLLDLSGRANL